MDWYTVTKVINGRAYLYRQQTWRDGDRVRTRSQYIGPASGSPDGGPAGPVAPLPPQRLYADIQPHQIAVLGLSADRLALVLGLLQITTISDKIVAASIAPRSLERMQRLKRQQPAFKIDARVLALPLALGVTVTTRPAMPFQVDDPTGYDGGYYLEGHDRVQMPDPARYTSQPGLNACQRYHNAFMHELAHATGHSSRLDRDALCLCYAEEEIVAETAAVIVSWHLGLAPPTFEHSAYYVQHFVRPLRQLHGNDLTYRLGWLFFYANQAAQFLIDRLPPV
jgi:hypothetical protein